MREIRIKTETETLTGVIYDQTEIDWNRILFGEKSRKGRVRYFDTPCAFDIETTNMTDTDPPYAFMYHWQMCLGDQVVFGRTWSEFRELLERCRTRLNLSENNRLVIYVHNLGFEFQFMRHFINVSEMFARAERHPMKFLANGCIEFRCSMILSNMSLEKFCENSKGVRFQKMSGAAYNYSKIRTAATPMTEAEEAYCYCDVRGLCECLADRLREDSMANIPLTSTGYVRRQYRNSVTKNPKNRQILIDSALDAETYGLCRQAFRGGETHANLTWLNSHLHNVSSYDLQSSYPAVMMMDRFPMTGFFDIPADYISRPEFGTEYAYMCSIRMTGCRYIGNCGIPYIPVAKCYIEGDRVNDNGRVLYADRLYMTVTDIDLQIILHEYEYESFYVGGAKASRYGYLSDEFRQVLIDLYSQKTALKGDDEHYYEYVKAKNRVNASYGMMVTRIDMPEITYEHDEFHAASVDVSESLDKYYAAHTSFLSYQHGVWVTAHARRRLREMLWTVGADVVYCDTDSIKCKGDHAAEFDAINQHIIAEAEKLGAYADDRNGKRQYMGIWDYEGRYDDFKTLGAKKYVYTQNGHTVSTIAGVSKQAGSRFFAERGIDAFVIGQVIPNSGHLVAYYDDSDIHDICVNGCHMMTAASVALIDDTYTIGITGEYADLLEKALHNIADL